MNVLRRICVSPLATCSHATRHSTPTKAKVTKCSAIFSARHSQRDVRTACVNADRIWFHMQSEYFQALADGGSPSWLRPSGVRSASVLRPIKSTSKSSGEKSGGVRPARKCRGLTGQVGAVLGAPDRRADIHYVAVPFAFVLMAQQKPEMLRQTCERYVKPFPQSLEAQAEVRNLSCPLSQLSRPLLYSVDRRCRPRS